MAAENYGAFLDWLDSYSASMTPVFNQFSTWYPDCADGFDAMLNGFQKEVNDVRALTKEERRSVAEDCQNYCNRMASLLRGLARVASYDFPELAPGFFRISEEAGDLLKEYRHKLAARSGMTEADEIAEAAMSAS